MKSSNENFSLIFTSEVSFKSVEKMELLAARTILCPGII
jgi:hypothetical protein